MYETLARPVYRSGTVTTVKDHKLILGAAETATELMAAAELAAEQAAAKAQAAVSSELELKASLPLLEKVQQQLYSRHGTKPFDREALSEAFKCFYPGRNSIFRDKLQMGDGVVYTTLTRQEYNHTWRIQSDLDCRAE